MGRMTEIEAALALVRVGMLLKGLGIHAGPLADVIKGSVEALLPALTEDEKERLHAEMGSILARQQAAMRPGGLDGELPVAAYRRYGDVLNWKTIQAYPLPAYTELPPDHVRAWDAAVEEIKRLLRQRVGLPE